MENINKKIEPKEQGEVLELIKTYRFCNDKIAECVIEIKGIEEKKNELVSTIENTRVREKAWVTDMIAKYGQGRLNLDTMEWHPDQVAVTTGLGPLPGQQVEIAPEEVAQVAPQDEDDGN